MSRSHLTTAFFAALTGLLILANCPKTTSSIKPGIEHAGFPLVFAVWENHALQSWDGTALALDIATLLLLVIMLCAARWRARR
jgi:hypothetical protein